MNDIYFEDKYGKYLTKTFLKINLMIFDPQIWRWRTNKKNNSKEKASSNYPGYKTIDNFIRQCFIEITYRLDNSGKLILYGNLPNFTFAQLKIEENIINILEDEDTVKNKNHYEEIYKKIDKLPEKEKINEILEKL